MSKFTKLTEEQLLTKRNFIENYLTSHNVVTGSLFDANVNVAHKDITTMKAELDKDINIQVNRPLVSHRIEQLFGKNLAEEYIRQAESHRIYVHGETSLKPHYVSVLMYSLLLDGLLKLGGENKALKHLASYCGSFVNFLFSVSLQFAGAVATIEFLIYFGYFTRKDFGDNYLSTHREVIENELQHAVYAINQPAAARGHQSVFWNTSLYGRPYFDSMFGTFVFPDGSKPLYESLDKLQQFLTHWFNIERTKVILTFPVVTAAMLTKDKRVYDEHFAQFCAKELSEGNAFFVYQSDNADPLASCYRLRNEISDNTFSYSLGAGGVSTGSINMITINMSRLYQKGLSLEETVDKIQKYQVVYRAIVQDYKDAGMLPVYDAGFISLDKQFLTIGINGMVEAAEYIGIKIPDNPDYKAFINKSLKATYDKNKEAKTKYGFMFNTEFMPAENLRVKDATWDKTDGLQVPRDCYNSYFYIVEDDSQNLIDKFYLHGNDYIQYLDGGSAHHCNLKEYPTQGGFYRPLNVAAKTGCNYFRFSIRVTVCSDCGYINKHTTDHCTHCHSHDVGYATRVIGYLKRISNFSKDRQKKTRIRYYGHTTV